MRYSDEQTSHPLCVRSKGTQMRRNFAVSNGLPPSSGVPFVHLLERINNLLSWTSHEKTTDFVDSGLVTGGDVRATQLAGTPTVPSPLVTDL